MDIPMPLVFERHYSAFEVAPLSRPVEAAMILTFRTPTLALLAGGALAAGAAQAQDANALYVRSLAASCAQCHGTDGRPAAGSQVPALAGLPENYTMAQMAAFKAATRPATVMTQLAKGYSDTQVQQLAAHFAAQKR